MDYNQQNMQIPPAAGPLPMDIISAALRYFRVRHLMRLRIVNNAWNDLILSGAFGRVHRTQMIHDNNWIYYFVPEANYRPLRSDGRYIYYRSDRLNGNGPNHINILCTCSGLVACTTYANDMYLWNPMMHIATPIPSHPIECPQYIQTGRVSFSLGHDNENDDFFLVRITIFGGMVNRNEVMIYSRNYGSWIRGPDFPHSVQVLQSGVPISGNLHWLVNRDGDGHTIARMNMTTFNYTVMRFDNHGDLPFTYVHLGRIGDNCLCLYSSLTPRGGVYHLSVLVNYNVPSSWIRIMIHLGDEICRFALYANLQPLQFVDVTQTRILFRVNPVGSFGIYDTISGVFEQLVDGEDGVEGEVSVVRILETLERPTRPFV